MKLTPAKIKNIRNLLIDCSGFNEKAFDVFISAIKRGDRVMACKEARAIREHGLRDALTFTDKILNGDVK